MKNTNTADLRASLIEARRAINSMKVEAETAGAGGDEQMLQEACEAISNEGLAATMAIDVALAAPASSAPADDAMFEFWWADHMPNSDRDEAWAEWCALRSNQPEPAPTPTVPAPGAPTDQNCAEFDAWYDRQRKRSDDAKQGLIRAWTWLAWKDARRAPVPASSEPDPMLPETKYNLGWASGWDAHARAHPPEKPAAVLARMEPFGYVSDSLPGNALAFHRTAPSELFKLARTVLPVFSASQVQAMLAAEREACAQVCESWSDERDYSAAIRARKE